MAGPAPAGKCALCLFSTHTASSRQPSAVLRWSCGGERVPRGKHKMICANTRGASIPAHFHPSVIKTGFHVWKIWFSDFGGFEESQGRGDRCLGLTSMFLLLGRLRGGRRPGEGGCPKDAPVSHRCCAGLPCLLPLCLPRSPARPGAPMGAAGGL